ncbi:MAG TPA: trigger factor [Actinomycetota bacterium]|nr:trigger factor [Actinomycetota bacterium]
MPEATLQTTTERLDKDRVKLRVELPPDALDGALSAAYKRWANDIKIPGFRKGKVPRQLIDQRVGPEVIREEALRDALPDFYIEALRAEDLEAIAPPEIQVVEFEPDTPIVFEATVDVRPEITLPDPTTLEITAPPAEVTDQDIDEQMERLRDRFAALETIGREVRRGDFALIDIKGYRHDELVEGASAPDFLYEVGSGTGPPKLDEELQGNRPGAILKFTDSVHIHSDDEPDDDHSRMEEISFTVLLKEVKVKKLPALDDDFAKTVGEFETIEDLREDLRGRLAEVKKNLVEEELRVSALTAFVEASDLEPPPKLVEGEFEHRLEHFEQELAQAGLSMDEYGKRVELTDLEIRKDLRAQAGRSVKAELLLEEIARRQDVEVTDEDFGREIAILAARTQRKPQEIAQELADSGRIRALAADIMRRKALDYLVENVTVKPNEGTVS